MAKGGGTCVPGLAMLAAVLLMAAPGPLSAASTVLERTEAERLARRKAAREGRLALPLPGTPDTRLTLPRLGASGLTLGARLMIRIFKAESELEVWMEKGPAYVRFATYPICFWSGTLGPKLREGDRQAPEGFYTITAAQLHHGGRWQQSLDVGFPNAFDRVNGRSGSLILLHGGCDSAGCFALTNAVNAEIYTLVAAALRSGARFVPVHVFPFRMTDANLAAATGRPWGGFWRDLKQGYDAFERTHLPPRISVCGRRYRIEDGVPGAPDPDGVALCPEDVALGLDKDGGANEETKAAEAAPEPVPCSLKRASCRRWVALRDERKSRRTITQAGPARAGAHLR